ncbi:MAG: DUF2284 domain-containing protein [Christensenellales bacterium]
MDNTEREKKLEAAIEKVAFQYKCIDSSEIEFSEEVREACKVNFCGRYNTCWTCPPAVGEVGDLKKKLTRFKRAFVYTTKHDIEDSFDMEGMFEARKVHDAADDEIIGTVEEIGGTLLGAGGCGICKKCAYPDAPCRFPDKARYSVESCGINVVHLAARCNINYINGENTVTYFSVIFFGE